MSLNLNLDQVAAAQSQKEVTINDMSGAIDAAVTETLSVDVSVSSQTLSSTQYRSATHFFVTGAAVGGKTVTLPAVKRLVAIESDSTNAATFAVTVGATSITMAIGGTALIYTDGTTDGIVQIGAPGGIGGPGDATTLDGLDSTAFAILAGQAGGQTLNGDTAASGNLILSSTAHGTKGRIQLGTLSTYDEVNDRLGIGLLVPTSTIHAVRASVGAAIKATHTTSTAHAEIFAGGTAVYFNQTGTLTTEFSNVSQVVGDATQRFIRWVDGKLEWGDGAVAVDTNLYRSSANLLKTDDSLFVSLDLIIQDNKDLKSSAFSTFNFLRLTEVTSNDTVLSGVGNIAVLIDSNNNNTDRAFEIRKNDPTQAGSTILLSVREDSVAGLGMEVPLHPWHVKVSNTLTSATQKLEQAGTGDVSLAFNISGVGGWNVGIDNSDSDAFKIGKDLADIGLSTLVRLEGTNKVGIGANVPIPSATLNVYENNTSVAPIFRVEQDSTGDAMLALVLTGLGGWGIGIDNSDADSLKIGVGISDIGASPTMTFLRTGKVGIGGNPTGNNFLHVIHDSSVTANPSITIENTSAAAATNAILSCRVAAGTSGDPRFELGVTTGGFWSIGIDNSDSDKLMISPTSDLSVPKLTIDSTGKIGIGTTAPSSTLHIDGGFSTTLTIEADVTGGSVINFGDSASDTAGVITYAHNIDRMAFATGDIDHVFIDSAGKVGIGHATPDLLLDIDTNGSADGIAIRSAVDSVLFRIRLAGGSSELVQIGGDGTNGITKLQLGPSALAGVNVTITGTPRMGIGNDSPAETLDVAGNVILSGELMGSRCCLSCGSTNTILDGATLFLRTTNGLLMTATKGFVMPRAGSIVGVTIATTISAFVAAGDFQVDVTKAGAVVFSKAVTVAGNGDIKGQATQARGVDTFVAGDILGVQLDNTLVSSDFTLKDHIAIIEVQFDT